jgi:uncharacterized protein DUF4399
VSGLRQWRQAVTAAVVVAVGLIGALFFKQSSEEASLTAPVIVAPLDGAELTSPVTLQIKFSGVVGTHLHLLIDSDPPRPSELVPMDERHLHLAGNEPMVVLDLAPGEHTLQLLIGTVDHRVPESPSLSQKVRITVLTGGQ